MRSGVHSRMLKQYVYVALMSFHFVWLEATDREQWPDNFKRPWVSFRRLSFPHVLSRVRTPSPPSHYTCTVGMATVCKRTSRHVRQCKLGVLLSRIVTFRLMGKRFSRVCSHCMPRHGGIDMTMESPCHAAAHVPGLFAQTNSVSNSFLSMHNFASLEL